MRNVYLIIMTMTRKNVILFYRINFEIVWLWDKNFVDGTFAYWAKFFLQLFTIHWAKNGYYTFSLMYPLLHNKSSTTYNLLFNVYKGKCSSIGLDSNLLIILWLAFDFEHCIRVAYKAVWLLISIVWCRFHLTQS